MPRPRRSYGRAGTKVIPTGWAAEHADVVTSTYESTIRVAPLGEPVHDDNGGTHTPAGAAVYEGAASITPAADGEVVGSAVDERTTTRTYEVKIPAEVAGIDPEAHFVWVTDSPDPDLVDAQLSIASVEYGDRRFSRLLQTTLTS